MEWSLGSSRSCENQFIGPLPIAQRLFDAGKILAGRENNFTRIAVERDQNHSLCT
jgi:hypothetical protein